MFSLGGRLPCARLDEHPRLLFRGVPTLRRRCQEVPGGGREPEEKHRTHVHVCPGVVASRYGGPQGAGVHGPLHTVKGHTVAGNTVKAHTMAVNTVKDHTVKDNTVKGHMVKVHTMRNKC